MKNNLIATAKARRLTAQAQAANQAGRYDEAIRLASKATALDDSTPEASYWLAASHFALENTDEAGRIARSAIESFPDHPELMALMGGILTAKREYGNARRLLQAALDRKPDLAFAWINYSALLFVTGEHYESRNAALKAIALAPHDISALGNYAGALKEIGEVEESIKILRRISARQPDNKNTRSNLLFTLLFDENVSALQLRKEAESYAEVLANKAINPRRECKYALDGRIRIGILSNDVVNHPCAYFLLPFIANIDRNRFEITVFCLNWHKDNVTRKVQLHANNFVDLAGKNETEIVKIIRDAGMDILIDLGGYTGVSPLHYMVHGLAPVQATWLGYPASTGMKQIHYRITDWIGDPAGYEAHYTENLLRTPGAFSAYYPMIRTPLNVYNPQYRVRDTPALQNGFITFGSCNNIAKITAKTLRLWSAVLGRCPDSKLLIEANGLDKEAVRAPLMARMIDAGIDTERVTFIPRVSANQYLTYHDIDIVLDTAPLTGGNTTCDALWMGVPVVSLAGHAFHARISASMLHAIGVDGLICHDEETYIEVASQLAADIEQLNALRLSIRPNFEKSSAHDAAGFSHWFEQQAIELVSKYRSVPVSDGTRPDGIFFGDEWHSLGNLVIAIASALQSQSYTDLRNLLENMSAKWSKHWLIAYALSEIEYHTGSRETALEILTESIGLRSYYLPLYRLLSARLDEVQHDKSALSAVLQQAFGIDIDYLDRQPVPSIFDVLGLKIVETEEALA